jgi:hypothetical protein
MLNGENIEIDPPFEPIINILNEKGYITLFCCSGHEGIKKSYIMFHPEVDLPYYPLKYQYKYPNVIKRQLESSEICSNAKEVLRWAETLPINPIRIVE